MTSHGYQGLVIPTWFSCACLHPQQAAIHSLVSSSKKCFQVYLKQTQERGPDYKFAELMAGSAGPVMAWALRLIPPECSTDPITHLLQHPCPVSETFLCSPQGVKFLREDTVRMDAWWDNMLYPNPNMCIFRTSYFNACHLIQETVQFVKVFADKFGDINPFPRTDMV